MAFRVRNSAATDGQSAYEILGVHEGATDESIRTAYRSLLEKWHPDRHKDAPKAANDMTKRVNEAYAAIRTAEHRSAYDQASRRSCAGSSGISAMIHDQRI
eukprot:scaffold3564_cov262-Pinguiococcus_pyrenoidosus.AAC.4